MLKFFPIFLKKNFHGNENFNKKLFLLKYSIHLEKIYQNRVTILRKKRFLRKFIFHQNFSLEKREKIGTKQFFSNISMQAGKNLIMSSGTGYLVTSRKNFLIGYLKELFRKLWTKIFLILKFFNHFFTFNFSYFTNHAIYVSNFFLLEMLH